MVVSPDITCSGLPSALSTVWSLCTRSRLLVVKNLPFSAEDMSSIPGQGTKTPHATGQLKRGAATTEPESHN